MSFQKLDTPEKGDLLRIRRRAGYYHFGIAISPERVVHFTGNDGDLKSKDKQLTVQETSLEKFVRGDVLEIEVPYSSPYTRDQVVKRAKKLANHPTFRGKDYNFIDNNCEHVARYCYDGRAESKQVVAGTLVIVSGVSALIQAVGKILKKKPKKKDKKPKAIENKEDI